MLFGSVVDNLVWFYVDQELFVHDQRGLDLAAGYHLVFLDCPAYEHVSLDQVNEV